MSNDLVAGNWREGLCLGSSSFVGEAEKRRLAGFRQMPYESTVVELVDLLDSYEDLYTSLVLDVIPVPQLVKTSRK